MDVLERIQELCKRNGINPSRLEIELELGRGTLYKWSKSSPNTDKISKVADYFDVSIDYLLGRTDNPKLAIIEKSKLPGYLNFLSDSSKVLIDKNVSQSERLERMLASVSAYDIMIKLEDTLGEKEFNNNISDDYEYFYLRIKDDSMDKEFKEGSLALVQKQEVIENGEIGLIAVKELDTVIRKVFINNSLITLMPQSNNLKYQPQTYDMAKEDVHVIGKVILAVNKY